MKTVSEMPICTPCGEPCEEGSSYIAVVEEGGQFAFHWGCEHHPVGDAAFYLGSEACMVKWLEEHPDYMFMLSLFFHKTQNRHIC